ncbi:hypothetical protein CJ739_1584 [Mariniflexile rhizosphaerae]|uniref:hypothetical protein n=1 Tax=unclassified Mariniflexile TaxID=2643887 RepID=UPI000CC5F004|nr:hypothetical protein [Mariniflexile sp. TRM1-10]AXP80672.1 hypothetical protein CJ739_1584 [Mariniflexile sp. TRM1-10]PLB17847.1 MAG: hypothetical protein TRG1_3297 [Flavobacteriaceae bacterium FS1-H7996/R]
MELVLVTIIALIISHIPAIIMFIVGKNISLRKPKTSKILYILATTYTIIGLGICGTILTNL